MYAQLQIALKLLRNLRADSISDGDTELLFQIEITMKAVQAAVEVFN